MIKSFHLLFILAVTPLFSFAQVPAVGGQVPNAPNEDPVAVENFFPGGILSDPEELALIDGLDDPLERVKLRDQDANMVLDMIQGITGRYILPPKSTTGKDFLR